MTLLDEEKVHLTTLDAGEVFVGGRYHSLIPIMQEVYEGGFRNFYAVAVIKKNTLKGVSSLRDLRGTRACFSNVGSLAGWVQPIYMVSCIFKGPSNKFSKLTTSLQFCGNNLIFLHNH